MIDALEFTDELPKIILITITIEEMRPNDYRIKQKSAGMHSKSGRKSSGNIIGDNHVA